MEAAADLIRAIATLIWPLAVIYLVIRLVPQIRKILEYRDFSIEVAGTKISVQQASDELSRSIDDLRSQLVEMKRQIGEDEGQGEGEKEPPPEPTRTIRAVLWVDDRPEANVFEIAALRRRGVAVEQAASTEEALQRMEIRQYDLVISDMGRRENGRHNLRAGLDLLEQARMPRPPFLFYTGSVPPQLRQQVQLAGADITTSPTELFQLIDRIGPLPEGPAG